MDNFVVNNISQVCLFTMSRMLGYISMCC